MDGEQWINDCAAVRYVRLFNVGQSLAIVASKPTDMDMLKPLAGPGEAIPDKSKSRGDCGLTTHNRSFLRDVLEALSAHDHHVDPSKLQFPSCLGYRISYGRT